MSTQWLETFDRSLLFDHRVTVKDKIIRKNTYQYIRIGFLFSFEHFAVASFADRTNDIESILNTFEVRSQQNSHT